MVVQLPPCFAKINKPDTTLFVRENNNNGFVQSETEARSSDIPMSYRNGDVEMEVWCHKNGHEKE